MRVTVPRSRSGGIGVALTPPTVRRIELLGHPRRQRVTGHADASSDAYAWESRRSPGVQEPGRLFVGAVAADAKEGGGLLDAQHLGKVSKVHEQTPVGGCAGRQRGEPLYPVVGALSPF